jgi:CubicO group peptidase (beta-lactamase class C family)
MFNPFSLLFLALLLGDANFQKSDLHDFTQRIVPGFLENWQVPGCVVVIVRKAEDPLILPFGIRQVGHPEKVTPDALFPLASCTKAFTSFLIGTAVQEDKMLWDDPVRKLLPDFQLSDPNASQLVSLRDLLSHRTGVGSHDFLWYRAPWGMSEAIKKACRLPLEKPFRGAMQYQTVMYMAAGQALEKATATPWKQLFEQKIASPLGMKQPQFTTVDYLKSKDHAAGHRRDLQLKTISVPEYDLKEPNPAGSLYLSGNDLSKWLQLLLNGGKFQEKTLLESKNFNELFQPQIAIPMDESARRFNPETRLTSYGLGWIVQDYRGRLLISHGGIIDGYRSHLTILPEEGLAIGVLANFHASRMNIALCNQLIDHYLKLETTDWNAYYRKLMDENVEAEMLAEQKREQNRLKFTVSSIPQGQFAGQYENPAYGEISVTFKDNQLLWEWGSFHCPLQHFEHNRYRIVEGLLAGMFVDFKVRNGKVTGMETFELPFARK